MAPREKRRAMFLWSPGEKFRDSETARKGGETVNARQKKFCDEYLIDLNATQAAIRAGYSEHTARSLGQRLLTNVDVSAYIQQQLDAIHSEKTADAQEVMEYLTSVMRGEHTEQVLQLIGDGVQKISDMEVSAKDRLRAAELIGKRYGIFTDKTDLSVSQPIVIEGGGVLED